MANVTISGLYAAAALTGTEEVPIVQGASTVRTTTQDIANLGSGVMAAGSGTCSIQGSGCNNLACGDFSFTGGGQCNTNLGLSTVIGGGYCNLITPLYSNTCNLYNFNNITCSCYGDFIKRVILNSCYGDVTACFCSGTPITMCLSVAPFTCNMTSNSSYFDGTNTRFQPTYSSAYYCAVDTCVIVECGAKYSTINGGYCNTTCNGCGSFIGGGSCNNLTTDSYNFKNNVIGGGCKNTISGTCTNHSFIGAGTCNTISGNYTQNSFIAAGNSNTICCAGSFIGSGYLNVVSGNISVIGGGGCNTIGINSDRSTISGGYGNITCGSSSAIGGGYGNTACQASTVSGGYFNTANGCVSSIVGGRCNTASGRCSFIGGGECNCACGVACFSTIVGGNCNIACQCYSFIGGGSGNIARCAYTGVFGCNLCNDQPFTFMSNNFVVGDFVGCGGCSLALDSSGKMCIGAGGGASVMAAGSGCCSIQGSGCNNTASGSFSFLGGGCCNSASGCYGVIVGGSCNSTTQGFIGTGFCNCITFFGNSSIVSGAFNYINTDEAFIGSGVCNSIEFGAGCSFIGGGACNKFTFSGYGACYGVIAGGLCNTVSAAYAGANYSTIGGGNKNTITASAYYLNSGHTISGGECNTICGSFSCHSFIGGGFCNLASAGFSFVGGGQCNITSAAYSGAFGCNITNTTACSFMSNQLIACNIFGAGNICADANGVIVPVVSDERLKTNICSLACGIDRVSLLNPVTYNWIDEKYGKGGQIGFIAQEVEKIVPEAVFKTSNDDYGFNDRPLVALLTKTVQEQEIRMKEQEVRITKLEKLVQDLLNK